MKSCLPAIVLIEAAGISEKTNLVNHLHDFGSEAEVGPSFQRKPKRSNQQLLEAKLLFVTAQL